jgi:MoaA/NifB/PqqE/SkfB family radical SAM enzyme
MSNVGANSESVLKDIDSLRRAMAANTFYRLDKVKIKIIDQCNLRCLKCNHWLPERRQGPNSQSPLTTDEWLDTARQLIELGVKKAAFTGGEPTLYPGLSDVIHCLAESGVRCSMTTNGTLLTGRLPGDLVSAGLSQIRFSVDGPSAELHDRSVGVAGSFGRLMSALKQIRLEARAAGQKIRLTFNTVVSDINMKHLPPLIDIAAEQGVGQILLMEPSLGHLPITRRDQLKTQQDLEQCYEKSTLPELIVAGRRAGVTVTPLGFQVLGDGSVQRIDRGLEFPCFLAWYTAAIYPGGDVQVCCHSRDQRLGFGNVRRTPLAEMLQGPAGDRVRDVCQAPTRYVQDCRVCDLYTDLFLQAKRLGHPSVKP